jgi:translation initiation factor 4E
LSTATTTTNNTDKMSNTGTGSTNQDLSEHRDRGKGPTQPTGPDGEDIDADEHLPPLVVPPNEHRLQYTYGLWYIGKTNYQQYDLTLRKIGRFASVEQFWALYSHIVRPNDLHSPSDFFLFKDGIKPMWEHKGNKNGGQWTVRLNKGLAARCWENLILALLGEQFGVGDEICGAGVSTRQKKDCISLWHKTSADTEACEKIRDGMRRVLNLPGHIQLEYRNHRDVIQWVNSRDGPGERERGGAVVGPGGDRPAPGMGRLEK